MACGGIEWPPHRDFSATAANAATAQRIERGRLLTAAGLPDVAESELRFGAKTETEQPQLLALEMAGSADSSFRALRIMKSFSGDYLSLPLENASIKFWQMLFPLPYKDEVFENARAHGLDPFYVAGLIRQESEFNPSAKSRANAYGLMQLLPSTGRMLGRKDGMRAVPSNLLFNPGVSIRLGTAYLRGQLDAWDGDWYRTWRPIMPGPAVSASGSVQRISASRWSLSKVSRSLKRGNTSRQCSVMRRSIASFIPANTLSSRRPRENPSRRWNWRSS